MDGKGKPGQKMDLAMIVLGLCRAGACAETICVDGDGGDDANPGTQEEPVRTIARAAEMVNDGTEPGPTTVKLAPGVHIIDKTVTFENQRV